MWAEKNIGRVPAKTNHDSWLRTQKSGFQNDVLGKAKADIFRGGVKLDKFVDKRGAELTLPQLRKRAGLDKPVAAARAATQPAWTPEAQQAWHSSITSGEEAAFSSWTGNGYTDMRNVQRGRTSNLDAGTIDWNQRKIATIDKALDRAPVYNTGETLYRGAPMRGGDFKSQVVKGKTFKFDTFASTSLDREVADDFIMAGKMDYPDAESIMYKIQGKQTQGVNIAGVSNMKVEKEILLRKGQSFRIIDVIKKSNEDFGDYWEVILEQVI